MEEKKHYAWRSFSTGRAAYVEHISNGHQKGDRYSYTTDKNKKKLMTESQCKAFCSYMKDCGTKGFWF